MNSSDCRISRLTLLVTINAHGRKIHLSMKTHSVKKHLMNLVHVLHGTVHNPKFALGTRRDRIGTRRDRISTCPAGNVRMPPSRNATIPFFLHDNGCTRNSDGHAESAQNCKPMHLQYPTLVFSTKPSSRSPTGKTSSFLRGRTTKRL